LGIRLQINGDTTTSNYNNRQLLSGAGVAVTANTNAPTADGCEILLIPGTNANANAFGWGEVTIPMYAATAFHKGISGTGAETFGATPTIPVFMRAFVWKSTAAITSLKFTAGGTAFVDGSVFTLYGLT
jgi:hypothetical protein